VHCCIITCTTLVHTDFIRSNSSTNSSWRCCCCCCHCCCTSSTVVLAAVVIIVDALVVAVVVVVVVAVAVVSAVVQCCNGDSSIMYTSNLLTLSRRSLAARASPSPCREHSHSSNHLTKYCEYAHALDTAARNHSCACRSNKALHREHTPYNAPRM
jgi:hypothetical protein